ncbi:MAG: preprotein translocase subunit SecG [Clostridiales bacterium]|nr:preprotein translocase subunit SecG [Clostridiales bacterium]
MDIVLGIILLIAAVFLIVSVLLQNGKSHNLSGAIAGGAETFFGKNKGTTADKMLSKLTTVVAVVFCLIVVAMYVFQKDTDYSSILQQPNVNDVQTEDTADDVNTDTDTDAADQTENNDETEG